MAATIHIGSGARRVGGGGTITYKGNPDRCIWWELVGVDAMVEGAAFGLLANEQHITDADGYATVSYVAPVAALDPDQWDRIKVYESMAV
jgi:hypothetical protein